MGLGGVARGLLELWSERPDPRFEIVWATDSSGAVVGRGPIPAEALLAAKRRGDLGSLTGATFRPGARPAEVVADEPCDALANLLPCNYQTGEPALPVLSEALEGGTHVVTAEKASLVLGFERLRQATERGGSRLRYSACVGGSVPFVPILEWLRQAHTIRGVTGVLNATTTYLLTELEARRATPTELVERAAGLGILERDPAHDLDGWDLLAKAAIVHNTLYRDVVPWGRLRPVGIRRFLDEPQTLVPGTRLVAHVAPGDVRVEARQLPMHSPLRVYGLENALLVDTPHAGELYVRGIGAGGRGTATNVYGDLLRVASEEGGEQPHGTPPVPDVALQRHV